MIVQLICMLFATHVAWHCGQVAVLDEFTLFVAVHVYFDALIDIVLPGSVNLTVPTVNT
jgi:hypothetical protein